MTIDNPITAVLKLQLLGLDLMINSEKYVGGVDEKDNQINLPTNIQNKMLNEIGKEILDQTLSQKL